MKLNEKSILHGIYLNSLGLDKCRINFFSWQQVSVSGRIVLEKNLICTVDTCSIMTTVLKNVD